MTAISRRRSPCVSICLPIFNGEQFLEEAIASILNQTYSDFELLLVDDGSTDASHSIVDSFAQSDSRISVLRNVSRLGLFANYNECMKQARAPFLKLMGQDDVLHPHAIERSMEVFDEFNDLSLVTFAKFWIDDEGKPRTPLNDRDSQVTRRFSNDTTFQFMETAAFAIAQKINWIGEPATVMLRRSCVGDGFDIRFRQIGDLDFWLRLLRAGDGYYLSDRLCKFRLHAASESSRNASGVATLLDHMYLAAKNVDVLTYLNVTLEEYCRELVLETSARLSHEAERDHLLSLWSNDDLLGRATPCATEIPILAMICALIDVAHLQLDISRKDVQIAELQKAVLSREAELALNRRQAELRVGNRLMPQGQLALPDWPVQASDSSPQHRRSSKIERILRNINQILKGKVKQDK